MSVGNARELEECPLLIRFLDPGRDPPKSLDQLVGVDRVREDTRLEWIDRRTGFLWYPILSLPGISLIVELHWKKLTTWGSPLVLGVRTKWAFGFRTRSGSSELSAARRPST
jgi:hypothetical protein